MQAMVDGNQNVEHTSDSQQIWKPNNLKVFEN
jgi:hypothetical protein